MKNIPFNTGRTNDDKQTLGVAIATIMSIMAMQRESRQYSTEQLSRIIGDYILIIRAIIENPKALIPLTESGVAYRCGVPTDDFSKVTIIMQQMLKPNPDSKASEAEMKESFDAMSKQIEEILFPDIELVMSSGANGNSTGGLSLS